MSAEDEAAVALFLPAPHRYERVRFLFLRGLGALYLVAFLSLADQIVPLVGQTGLLPAGLLADRDGALPTFFSIVGVSDVALVAAALGGAALGLAVLLGATHAPALLALWVLQLSMIDVGQLFLGYGWEILLAEAGLLAIFLCPVRSVRPFPLRWPASPALALLYRWLLFRLMFGAGLIKLRGDPCWRDLSCLDHHYETQPLPSPLSTLWHHLPSAVLHGGVLVNHVVELVVPFGLFGPRPVRLAAGAITVAFQLFLALSGNLSTLNWLSIVIALWCFDDEALGRLGRRPAAPLLPAPRTATVVPVVLAVVVGILSVGPVLNLLSPDQRMNASFDPLHLVNTYGAFGTVGRTRRELSIEGSGDADPHHARWRAYALPCQPGPVGRRPCFVAPWPLRLDWQIWFAAGSEPDDQPWLVHLVWQLLRGDRDLLHLFSHAPFPSRAPPRWIRIQRWRYRLAPPGAAVHWVRDQEESWMRPLSLDDPGLREYVALQGWTD